MAREWRGKSSMARARVSAIDAETPAYPRRKKEIVPACPELTFRVLFSPHRPM
jgi:hypothetical protein